VLRLVCLALRRPIWKLGLCVRRDSSCCDFPVTISSFPFCACRDWGLIGELCSDVDLNQQSKDGSTPLHLAAWNGQAAAISSVLAPWPNGVANLLAASVSLNVALAPLSGPPPAASSSAYSELDLAIKKQHLHTARLLIRSDGTPCELSGHKGADELLHRCVLLGDGITAEKMFRNDAFRVQVRRGRKDSSTKIDEPALAPFVGGPISHDATGAAQVCGHVHIHSCSTAQSYRPVHVRVHQLWADGLPRLPRPLSPALRLGGPAW